MTRETTGTDSHLESGGPARRAHWDDRYRTVGVEQVSWYEPTPRLSLALVALAGATLDRPTPALGVIDVGGGASGLSRELAATGATDVTVLDLSAEALERARSGADGDSTAFVRADLLDWAPERRWEVWHDRAVFHFLTEADQRSTYRRVLHDALAPRGVAIVATFAADGPSSCSGLPVRRYRPAELVDELGDDFEEVAQGRYRHVTPSGGQQPLTWVVLQRRAED